jgi:hypothetical protein
MSFMAASAIRAAFISCRKQKENIAGFAAISTISMWRLPRRYRPPKAFSFRQYQPQQSDVGVALCVL